MADYGTAISLSREVSHTSDDSSSDHSPRTAPLSSSKHMKKSSSHHDRHQQQQQFHHHHTAAMEITAQRKPRGRPPGSKNRPKPPIIITKDTDSAMKPAILEISPGLDVIHSIIEFARRNHSGISVISATGSVSNVTLRHPLSHAPSLSLHGPFNLLSLTGSFIGSFASKQSSTSSSSSSSHSPSPSSGGSSCYFGISLAGAQGQVFGGIVAGKVLAAAPVVVVAATFFNPTFHRLSNDHQHNNNDEDDGEGEETKPGNISGPATGNQASMTGYVSVANPTPINCQMSPPPPPPPPPPHIMQWPGPPRPHY